MNSILEDVNLVVLGQRRLDQRKEWRLETGGPYRGCPKSEDWI